MRGPRNNMPAVEAWLSMALDPIAWVGWISALVSLQLARRQDTRRLATLTAALALVLFAGASPFTANRLLARLEAAAIAAAPCPTSPPPEHVVLLAGGVQSGNAVSGATALTDTSWRRLIEAVELARDGDRLLYVSGGQGQERREADLLRDAAIRLGMPAERIRVERESVNTNESLRRLAAMPGISSPSAPAMLVTSAYHLPRALAAARTIGLSACGHPADFRATAPSPVTLLLPQAHALEKTSLVVHEVLARWRDWLVRRAYPERH